MSVRQSMACNVTPLLLRLALGVTFVWAGWGKCFKSMEYPPAQLATLANMGIGGAQKAAGAKAAPTPNGERPGKEGGSPADPLPEPSQSEGGRPGSAPSRQAMPQKGFAAVSDAPMQPLAVPTNAGSILAQTEPAAGAEKVPTSVPGVVTYTESDFAGPASLPGAYGVALALHGAAHPPAGGKPYFPAALASKPWVGPLTWAAAITELAGGVLLLAGFFSRFAALGIAAVMATAFWLTQVGPNLGAPGATLGFLPPLKGLDPGAATTMLFQFTLLMCALGVFFSGAGAVSVDGALGRRRAKGGESKAAPKE